MRRMFSSRLDWNVPANPLARLLESKRMAGARVLDLTESNPTRAGISYPRGIVEALAAERALRYEPSPKGLVSAREAVAKYYSERGRDVSPDRVLLTASTSEAYAYLFKLLADPGDEVLTPRPSYPLFDFLAALESVSVRQYPLRYDGAWRVDFDALERAISGQTRAIVAVDPNNPTGSFLDRGERERLEEIALARGLALLIDEVFSEYAFGGIAKAEVLASRALTFTMGGLSKLAGLPQMKLAWIVVDGDRAEQAMERLEWIADTYLSVATPVQVALGRLLELSSGVRAQIRERTRENLARLRAQFTGSAVEVLNVQGGWTAILRVPRIRSEQEWALMLLGERDVLVQPGYFYDFESEAFLVVSLLTAVDAFEEGIRRIM